MRNWRIMARSTVHRARYNRSTWQYIDRTAELDERHGTGDRGRGEMVNRGEYAVLWDVDGVLIDSGEQHRRAWEQLAREEHLPYSDAAFWATFGMRNTDIFPRMFGIAGPPERIAALGDRKEAIYRALLAEDAVALPGAKELLAALHAAGYRQALGSSAPPANLEAIISLLDIAPLLDAVVSGEQVAHGKPAPDIFPRRGGAPGDRARALPRHRRRARRGRRRPRGRDALPGGAPRGPARCARTRRRRRAGRLAGTRQRRPGRSAAGH